MAPAPAAAARPGRAGRVGSCALGRFARRKPLGAVGGVIVLAMLVMAVFAEQIAPYGYDETIRGARMKPPSAAHWLGTDNLSRDMWSRIVYGARVSITVGFLTIALAVLLATAIGVSSAYFGGVWDLVVQRVVDAWLSFPVPDHHPVGDGRAGPGAGQRGALAGRPDRRHQLARDPRRRRSASSSTPTSRRRAPWAAATRASSCATC